MPYEINLERRNPDGTPQCEINLKNRKAKMLGIGQETGEGVTDPQFGLWRDGDERDANARLIAAAPDLLAALKAVVRVADRKTVEFDLAHAAISKAEAQP